MVNFNEYNSDTQNNGDETTAVFAAFSPFSRKSDQTLTYFLLHNPQKKRLWELMKWLPKGRYLIYSFIIYLITSTIWCGTHNRAGLQFKCVLRAQERLTTPPGSTSPILFKLWCRFFYQRKWCETGPTVFRPYPRRLESLTVYRCHCKGSTFSSVILRPRVLVRPGFEPTTSSSADRRSPNWANQADLLITSLY